MTETQRQFTKRGLDLAATYLHAALTAELAPFTVYLEDDLEGIAQLFAQATGVPISVAREQWQTTTASAPYRQIFVYLGSESWVSRPDWVRLKILAHEAFHLLQYELAGPTALNGGLDEVPTGGPRWLVEGAAEYVGHQAVADAGLIRMEDARNQWISRTRLTVSPLSARETSRGLFGEPEPYQISPLAVDLLLGSGSGRPLVAYYGAIRGGSTWQAAFSAAFGKSINAFYDDFEAYRQTFTQPIVSRVPLPSWTRIISSPSPLR